MISSRPERTECTFKAIEILARLEVYTTSSFCRVQGKGAVKLTRNALPAEMADPGAPGGPPAMGVLPNFDLTPDGKHAIGFYDFSLREFLEALHRHQFSAELWGRAAPPFPGLVMPCRHCPTTLHSIAHYPRLRCRTCFSLSPGWWGGPPSPRGTPPSRCSAFQKIRGSRPGGPPHQRKPGICALRSPSTGQAEACPTKSALRNECKT